jgi:mannose-1-phosphate guanylyltransferase
MTTNNNYCLILAGGVGRRLWPCSRSSFPKQFVDFFGTGRTQLQQTYDRMVKILPSDHIFINTHIDYADIVMQQLPEVDKAHILAEPVNRNTAPSVAWACHRLHRINADANIIVVPSDQMVLNEEAFGESVLQGLDFVATHRSFLTLGVKPTRPEPGYGYIQVSEPVDSQVFRVKTFTEKPDREFAQMFMESGEFYWNTGLFLANVGMLYAHLSALLPLMATGFDSLTATSAAADEEAVVAEVFPLCPNLSLESGILEKSDDVCVMKCNFGWADIGTWHSIYEALPKNDDDNVVIDSEVMMEDSHQNIIMLPKGKLGVINGLEGFIVAEQDNVLLICKKEDSSALIRKYVNEVQLKKGEDYV